MPSLFISYRRDDSQGYAGRLADDLSLRLGADRVFSDIEIPSGSDFAEVLHRAIAASDALLVVIGQRWVAPAAPGRPARLFDPDDWVRTEIEAALLQRKLLLPVLVGGAPMPGAEQLPENIRRLVRFQAAELDDRHWAADLARLEQRLQALLPGLREGAAPADETPAQVLREIARRVLDESQARRPAPPPQPARLAWWLRLLLPPLWRAVRKLLMVVLVLALVYVGVKLFGDDSLLRQLAALEARALVGWQRLLKLVAAL